MIYLNTSMADKFQIKINSILGGQAQTANFAAENQFSLSYGINPGQTASSGYFADANIAGLIQPVGIDVIYSGSGINKKIKWMEYNPKDANIYLYDASGSAYTLSTDPPYNTITALSDGGTLSNSTGNGIAYYDNYIYFAKNTTVARYGPLNGTPQFNGDYWGTTLGKAALTDTTYSYGGFVSNHYLHRHSDGKLYIADVVGNTGTLHYIKTKKTTVEGDTDDGSTYDAVHFGYGLYPTCIESYGEQLAIALYEGRAEDNNYKAKNAKLAFWDTTSQNANQIIWNEFPDYVISSLKNVNGVLYIISGYTFETRISKYIGGYSIQEVFFNKLSLPPTGAVVSYSNRLFFASAFNLDAITKNGVFSIGLTKATLGQGLFCIMPCSNNTGIITAIAKDPQATQNTNYPIITAWFASDNSLGLDRAAGGTDAIMTDINPFWLSQRYKIGQPFKINKLSIYLGAPVDATTEITPMILTDGNYNLTTLTTINNTNYPDKRRIVIRPQNLVGNNDFNLYFQWSNVSKIPISFPITIEYELLPLDD